MEWKDPLKRFMSKSNHSIEALFEAALDFETREQQAEFLNGACPDPDMRREVESLLTSHLHPDSIFSKQENAHKLNDE